MEKVVGEAAVEGLAHIGLEGERMQPHAAAVVVIGALCQHFINGAAIGCRDVLDIRRILQSALDFERHYSSIHHGLEVLLPAHILQREQVAVALNDAAVIVHEVESQTAELRATAAVGRTVKLIGRGIATPAVTDAQGSVHEGFDIESGQGFVYLANTLQRTLARQNYPCESLGLSLACVFHPAVVHLRGGMKGNGSQASLGLQFGQGGILRDKGIHACLVQLLNQRARLLHLAIIENGVEGHIYARIVYMSKRTQGRNIRNGIASCCARTKRRTTDIYGVRTMEDCFATDLSIAGRRQ